METTSDFVIGNDADSDILGDDKLEMLPLVASGYSDSDKQAIMDAYNERVRRAQAVLEREIGLRERARLVLNNAIEEKKKVPEVASTLFVEFDWFPSVYNKLSSRGILVYDREHGTLDLRCNNKTTVISQLFQFHEKGEHDEKRGKNGKKPRINWKLVKRCFGIEDYVNMAQYATKGGSFSPCKEYEKLRCLID